MRARIRKGALVSQDHSAWEWPGCKPPQSEYLGKKYKFKARNPDMVFDIELKRDSWECTADGYGMLKGGEYGNGSVHVRALQGVEIIDETGGTAGKEE